jgi:hypothetical protein
LLAGCWLIVKADAGWLLVDVKVMMFVDANQFDSRNKSTYWCVLRWEWMGMVVAGMIITSEPVDHSRKFPAFFTHH